MRKLINLLSLQLLGGEGGGTGGDGGAAAASDGTGGADSGVTPDAAGQARLEELGVPKDKIRKNRAYKASAQPVVKAPDEAGQNAETQQQNQQAAAAENDKAQTQQAKKPTWDEIMADPDYNKSMQNTLRARLKDSQAAQEKLNKLAPALELIGRSLNIDASDISKLDVDKLVEAITQDKKLYEDKASEMGVPVEAAMRIDQLEREKAARDRQEAQNLETQRIQQHLSKLQQQGEELKKMFPSFNLDQELQNPVFFRMTSPNVGISVQDAYYAVHRDEIQRASMQATAQRVSEKMSNSIQSGMRRPVENGAQTQPASVSSFDYRNATRAQREELKKQIQRAAARGEKIYPTR